MFSKFVTGVVAVVLTSSAVIWASLTDSSMITVPSEHLTEIPIPKRAVPSELSIEGFDDRGLMYQWEQALQAGEKAFIRGASGDSERHYRAALAAAEAMTNGQLQEAEVLDRLGLISVYNQKLDIAKTFLEKSLKIRQTYMTPSNLALAESLQHVGSLYQTIGRYKESESLLREAIEIRRVGLDKAHRRDLAASHISLAGVLWKTDRNADGDQEVVRGLSILKSVLGEKNMEYSLILRNISRTYLRFKRPDQALEYIKQAVVVCKNVNGDSAPALTGLLSDYAKILKELRIWEEAEAQVARALEISIASFGPESSVTYRCSLLLVDILASAQETDRARKKLDEAILLCQKMYGSNHPRVVKLKEKFAFLLRAGKESSLLTKIECPPEVGSLLRQWKEKGTATMKAGDFKTAVEYYQKAVNALERYSNFQDVYFVSLYGLAISYKSLKQYIIAESYMRRAVLVFEKLKGNDPSAMSEILLSHLDLLERLHRFDETVNVFSRLLLLEAEGAVKSDTEGRGNKLSWLVKRFNCDGEEAFVKGKKARAEAYFSTAVALAGQNALENLYARSLRNYSHFKEQSGEADSVWKPLMVRALNMHEKAFAELPSEIFAMKILFCDALFRHSELGKEFGDLVTSLEKTDGLTKADSLTAMRKISRWLSIMNKEYKLSATAGSKSHYKNRDAALSLYNGLDAILVFTKDSPDYDYLPVAQVVAATTAYRLGKIHKAYALFEKAFNFYLHEDGYLSPGCALVEYIWVHEAVRADNPAAGAKVRNAIAIIEKLPTPGLERDIAEVTTDGYWVTLFDEPSIASGKSAAVVESFNRLLKRPGTSVIKKMMEQILINALLSQV